MDTIQVGDFVFINGGDAKRIAEVRKGVRLHMGRSGAADADSLIGMRFGEVVRLDHAAKKFCATDEYPDLDVTDMPDPAVSAMESPDNRNLLDNNESQLLSKDEIAAIRNEKGIDALVAELVENSTTFQFKTAFSKEKYIKRKQKKYGTLFKVERVTPDNMSEVHLPTISPTDSIVDDSRFMRLRADTVALMLHHSDAHDGSRVCLYDMSNGLAAAHLLTRLGKNGRLFQLMNKSTQPNTFPIRQFGVTDYRERWTAVPRNAGFLEGVEDAPREVVEEGQERKPSARVRNTEVPSQWMKGFDAREELLKNPVDSIIVVDEDYPERPLADMMPYLAYGGHIVIYSPFLEDLSALFLKLRNDCVNIRISETWYRHHQVLPQRTHPTVNMNTTAGYLLTAIKVQPNPNPRPRFAKNAALVADGPSPGEKRPREEAEKADEPAAKEAAKEE